MCVVFLFMLAACNKSYDRAIDKFSSSNGSTLKIIEYDRAIGEFSSSNGSTLKIIEINGDTITYEISLIGFPTVYRTDAFDSKEGRLIAYYSPNGVDVPLIYLIYYADLDCWKNEAILPELDFYRN